MKNTLLLAVVCLLAIGCNNTKEENKMNDTHFIETLQTRVSVRHFTGEAVSAEQTEILLRSAMSAPSAVNKQPWDFIVVNDTMLIRQLGEALPNSRCGNGAGVVIVPCGNLQKTLEGEGQEFWIQDVSAATENLLLTAHAMGLGAVWTALYPNQERIEKAREILHFPEHIIPLCLVPVGVPAEQPQVKDKWKTENIHYNNWAE